MPHPIKIVVKLPDWVSINFAAMVIPTPQHQAYLVMAICLNPFVAVKLKLYNHHISSQVLGQFPPEMNVLPAALCLIGSISSLVALAQMAIHLTLPMVAQIVHPIQFV